MIHRIDKSRAYSNKVSNISVYNLNGDKMEKYLKYLPLGLFCLTIGKLLYVATWEGAATALVAGLLAGAYELKNQDKKVAELEDRFAIKIKELEDRAEVLTNVINNHAKAFEDIKTHVSGLNLARNLKQSQSAPIQKSF